MGNFSEKLSRRRRLFACSLQTIVKNKQLLFFPALGCCLYLGLMFFFYLPLVLPPSTHPLTDPQHWRDIINQAMEARRRNSPLIGIIPLSNLAVLHLLVVLVWVFCNVAFCSEIINALAGEKASVAAGLQFARRRVRSIVLWALFASAIGLGIEALQRGLDPAGLNPAGRHFLVFAGLGFAGLAWRVTSIFVIPIIIRIDCSNPLALLKNSIALVKKTWGEAVIGYTSLFGIIYVALVPLMTVAIVSYHLKLYALPLAVVLFAVTAVGFLATTAGNIYLCTLYVYASEGVVPTPFTAELMDGAWKVKKP